MSHVLRNAYIFISYRRSDNITMTGRIHDRLCSEFGDQTVFKDTEDIPAGADFRIALDQALGESAVVLVIIGQKWLTAADEDGKRRLEDPEDFVRVEVETALARPGTLVVPVLIDGTFMPPSD